MGPPSEDESGLYGVAELQALGHDDPGFNQVCIRAWGAVRGLDRSGQVRVKSKRGSK